MTIAIERVAGLGRDERRGEIVTVLVDHFHDLLEADPDAFRHKFRKMAASPLAFYRGSASLFYADMAREPDDRIDHRARRVWIQGDLHAENFGTYMNADGRLVFDVNDFDEAYVGDFGWDLRRLAASLALLGYAKAFADEEIRAIVAACARGYFERVHRFAAGANASEFALTLETTEGPLHRALEQARVASRVELLERLTVVEGCERSIRRSGRARDIDEETRDKLERAFRDYLKTLLTAPRHEHAGIQIKDAVAAGGFGIGSAGLPAFTLLLEGPTEALETDIVISLKQANVCAPSRIVDEERVRDYFHDHGHRTVVSQRALQAHADPWLGHTSLDGVGQVVKELSPYEVDLDWNGLNDAAGCARLAARLGEAVAKIHSVADDHSDLSLVPFAAEEAIAACIGEDGERFAEELAEFALPYADVVRDDHRHFVDAFRNHEIAGV